MGRVKSYIDEINPKLWYILIFYIVLTLIWVLSYFGFGHRYYQSAASGFFADTFKAVGANLIFFGVFGIATLLPTFTRPKDEPIDRRLGFLITSRNIATNTLSFIRQEIVRLCGFIEQARIEIILMEVDASINAIRLEHRSDCTSKNTFESEDYQDDKFTLTVHPDNKSKNGIHGAITLAEFSADGADTTILKTPHILTSSVKYEKVTSMKIRKNSTTRYRMHCWIWYDPIAPYYVHNCRYTELLIVEIRNDSTQVLRIRNEAADGVEIDLHPGEQRELYHASANPGLLNIFSVVSALSGNSG